ncbi:Protein kinase domain [Raineya orbicola]|uniref:Protein kinase domain n=2 Tax=Raineya orbicola TaxID=2016530 RepID=A0A2N3IK91_9BACT|nr:Protein kinase domain [Raineya orbicola]
MTRLHILIEIYKHTNSFFEQNIFSVLLQKIFLMKIGQNFYQYQIQSLIAESNTARNWLARHQSLPRNVRIKQLKNEFLQTEQQKIQLRSIAVQNAELEHGHIPVLYDYLENSQGIFFVYDYVNGVTLDKFLQSNPSAEKRKDIFLQILSAVAYSHRKGVCHLHISPSNILVTPENKVFLNDFGFIQLSPTPSPFSAPEQLQGGYTDTRTDIFMLGKLLAYLFPNPSAELQKVIQKACASEAYQRYQTCEEMQNDLQHAIFEITHQEPTKKNAWVSSLIGIGIVVLFFGGAWWGLRIIAKNQQKKPQTITFQGENPVVIQKPKDTTDYTKLAEMKQQEEKEKQEEDSEEERKKDSLKKKQEERKKLEKERKEKALKNVIVDGQFVSNQLGEYKINVEIFNGNKDLELQKVVIVVSYFDTQGEIIAKEEKVLEKLSAEQATSLEVVKKINAARFSCKVKDAELPPLPEE